MVVQKLVVSLTLKETTLKTSSYTLPCRARGAGTCRYRPI
jgi:hypothetical protein